MGHCVFPFAICFPFQSLLYWSKSSALHTGEPVFTISTSTSLLLMVTVVASSPYTQLSRATVIFSVLWFFFSVTAQKSHLRKSNCCQTTDWQLKSASAKVNIIRWSGWRVRSVTGFCHCIVQVSEKSNLTNRLISANVGILLRMRWKFTISSYITILQFPNDIWWHCIK